MRETQFPFGLIQFPVNTTAITACVNILYGTNLKILFTLVFIVECKY